MSAPSPRYPHLRIHHPRNGALVMRECLNISFYIQRPHTEVGPRIGAALDLYLRAVGPEALTWFPDENGNWRPLDAREWKNIRHQLNASPGARIELNERPDAVSGYVFDYRGNRPDPFRPDALCAVSFWLPTEFLEARGPDSVCDLARELGRQVPFTSGHAGLAINMIQIPPETQSLAHRHPGMDIPDMGEAAEYLGSRIRGAHWLTFLGPPVLSALGGPHGLRARLPSGIDIQALDDERAVVRLGEGPEAGDTEHAQELPAYRELARVLEPWLHPSRHPLRGFTAEETRRWERRFLDPSPHHPESGEVP